MAEAKTAAENKLSEIDLDDLVASSDTGGRNPEGGVGKFLTIVAICWSLYQLWIASPLPFIFADIIPIPNNSHTRPTHLSFAIFLAFMAYPAFANSPKDRIPIGDWILAIVGTGCAAYLAIFADDLASVSRVGQPNTADLVVSGVGLVCLLEATRRALGPPLMIVAIVFASYIFFGQHAPEIIAWQGASFDKAMSHLWITQEGVFGIALGVSTSFVFLFVLFGALLDKAGAGNYFIKVAFAALGHLRGGPAKAAVLASAMTGLISGSSIANVVTTGTFTIPLMKRVGFSAEKAGSVEVASSVNGQIMPPVMGAAAFLMVEYVGISYQDVVKHAFLPAVISYIALFYLVDLEAAKNGMKGLPKSGPIRTAMQKVNGFLIGIAVTAVLAAITYYGIGWMKDLFGDNTGWALSLILLAVYVVLIRFAAQYPDLELDDPNAEVVELPEMGPTAKTGFHYLLPIVVLVWFLMIERKSPGLSAFWATALLIFQVLTQKPLKAFFRGESDYMAAFKSGVADLLMGMADGARNMIGIGVATATAGIIVGAVSLTGIGQVMAELVEFLSGGHLMVMLILVAIISLILGMGLPTTANYIVVSSLMAGVVVQLGAQEGLIVPLIAVHLFVFYFGIMADVTPPVGLASFAAAAVSGGDPLKTGFVAFFYSLRTVMLPFLFIFNTDLLLIDVGWVDGIIVFIVATAAMLVFAAGTQGYFFARSKIYESVLLILIAFTLFRPGFWLDMVWSPYHQVDPTKIDELAADLPAGSDLRVLVGGEDLATGQQVEKFVVLPLGEKMEDGHERLLSQAGIGLEEKDGKMIVADVGFGSPAEKAKIDFDWEVKIIELPTDRLPKEIFWIPAMALLGLIIVVQRRRGKGPGEA
ncbi:MAG: TRAP transporter permease [Rhodospirillales bacterium]|nr:TRAP transporter permease [Rhodospirillales bacterium]